MLTKMGWSEGQGLGREHQGMSNSIKAVRRQGEALGIGASIDVHGGSGFEKTRDGFVNVLDRLKEQYQQPHDSSDNDDNAVEVKRKKSKKKSSNNKNKTIKKSSSSNSSSKTKKSSSSRSKSTLTLAQNKVTAGHAAKWREAKDLSQKSAADMAAVFGTSVTNVSVMFTTFSNDSASTKKKKKKKKMNSKSNI